MLIPGVAESVDMSDIWVLERRYSSSRVLLVILSIGQVTQ